MKKMLLSLLILLHYACASQRPQVMIRDENLKTPEGGVQTEHKLIVLDPGFETWFSTTWSPAKDRSYSYYDNWNDRYVQAWNNKATSPGHAELYNSRIEYDYSENYGMEVSRKLYYYFRWVETQLGLPIISSGGPIGMP
jgi:hypothetical protein